MSTLHHARRAVLHGAGALLGLACACAYAQDAGPTRTTVEVGGSQGRLTAGLQDASALNLRGTWEYAGGDVLRAEALDERKFGSHGGIGAVGYTRILSPDWFATGTLAFGHGGLNWARRRVDVEVSTKWGEERRIVTRAALYHAAFDQSRSDRGLRLGAVAYLTAPIVIEGGITFNVSDPGGVNSSMPFASITYGRDGDQYVSLRANYGSEAYQAIGAGQQLVDFKSRSVGLAWRRWMAPRWGFVAQVEGYHNPTYERTTVGAGLFVQW